MSQRDPQVLGAAPEAFLPWAVELGRTLGGLVTAYRPGGPVGGRTRERLILAVSEVDGCRYGVWVHDSWSDFLGSDNDEDDAAASAVRAYARDSAGAGRPVDPRPLADVLPPSAVAAVRATVAQVEVSNLVGQTIDAVLADLGGRRTGRPRAGIGDVVAAAAALPVALPLIISAGLLRAMTRLAPPAAPAEAPPEDEANLLVHLLAKAVPTYLANAAVRTALLGPPVPLAVALRAGRTAATVRFGRGRVALANGITPDALLVIELDVGPLVRTASGSLGREMAAMRAGPA